MRTHHCNLRNTSEAKICRALNFDMILTRKNLMKAAREAASKEIKNYYEKLRAICSYPEWLLFLYETSKDGRDEFRLYAHSKNGTRAVLRVPFNRRNRVSMFAALECNSFMSWTRIEGTCLHKKFHNSFIEFVIPCLSPWALN